MIITQKEPYTNDQIVELQEQFGGYIKTVIDIEERICSAGMDRHYQGEEILLKQGSLQKNIWGGGIDVDGKVIDYNSFINIRPNDNNPSNDIISPTVRSKYEELTKYFFKELYD